MIEDALTDESLEAINKEFFGDSLDFIVNDSNLDNLSKDLGVKVVFACVKQLYGRRQMLLIDEDRKYWFLKEKKVDN